MAAEITRDELLALVSVRRDKLGSWHVDAVKSDVRGDIVGNVWGSVVGSVLGNVRGSVLGDVRGHVAGDVRGNVMGSIADGQIYSNHQQGLVASQQQMYWVSLVGWEVWDAWYSTRADVRAAADGVVAASKKMAAANLAESAAWLAMKEAARASPLFSEDSHAHHRAERITR